MGDDWYDWGYPHGFGNLHIFVDIFWGYHWWYIVPVRDNGRSKCSQSQWWFHFFLFCKTWEDDFLVVKFLRDGSTFACTGVPDSYFPQIATYDLLHRNHQPRSRNKSHVQSPGICHFWRVNPVIMSCQWLSLIIYTHFGTTWRTLRCHVSTSRKALWPVPNRWGWPWPDGFKQQQDRDFSIERWYITVYGYNEYRYNSYYGVYIYIILDYAGIS